MRRREFLAVGALTAAGTPRLAGAGTASAVRVAAASDLKFALAHLASQYQSETGQAIELNFGSSGQFAQQIRQGLPVDLYMSADEAFVTQLADARLTQDGGALYALGRVALLVEAGSRVVLDPHLAGLRVAWPGITHFSIANPEHAPYGRAARDVLQRLGLWELAQRKLVLGENIAQATQYVTTGAAQAGISALSLALAPEVAQRSRHLVLPAELHAPLRQRMVLLRGARPQAAAFYHFLQAAPARTILQRYGFAFD